MTNRSWSIRWLDEVNSTNDQLKYQARQGAPDHTVLVARRQTQGRGRGGNRWASPEGGLYCSALVRTVPAGLERLLAFVAGESLCRTLAMLRFETPYWLKWPNDLLIAPPGEERPVGKAAGILVESASRGDRLEYAVIGTGVNLHTAEADLPGGQDPPAVAFRTFQDDVPEAAFFLDVYLAQLDRVMAQYGASPERLVQAVQARLAWGGERVAASLSSGGRVEGTLMGLSPAGDLRVDTPRGERLVAAWDVSGLQRIA